MGNLAWIKRLEKSLQKHKRKNIEEKVLEGSEEAFKSSDMREKQKKKERNLISFLSIF